jgi:hypothetical protein
MPIDTLVKLSVFGYPGWEADSDGDVYHNGELVPGGYSDGYVMVYLGMYKSIDRAKLVCTAWHGPKPEDKDLVAHNNGFKDDDRPSNLRWATFSENVQDAIAHGTMLPTQGEKHGMHKLYESDVLEIRSSSLSSRDLSYIMGVTQQTINDIRARRSWRHI